jgi:hypothetical protein
MNKANSSNPNRLDDGFGNVWSKCELGSDCGLQIVRPGKTQCRCDSIQMLYVENAEIDNYLKRGGWAGDGWYFWKETMNLCGPYSSRESAKNKLLKYLKTLDNEHSNN